MAEVVLQSTPEVLLDESFHKPPGLFSIAELCGDPEEQAVKAMISHSYGENRFGSTEEQSMLLCGYCLERIKGAGTVCALQPPSQSRESLETKVKPFEV